MSKDVLSKEELPPHKRSHSPPTNEKRAEEEPSSPGENPELESVHSANNWEAVELGDEQRKAKFLRLMGAAKKEHKGRIVIGTPATTKAHGRSSEEERNLEEKLETQYQQNMEDALRQRHKKHRGLGFDEAGNEPTEPEKTSEARHKSTEASETADKN